ncbi:MAG: hypothetical protein ACOX3Q_05860 [Clostridia bacterium]|jgi:hypothetical protein|nr:hypothetical protein [Clostridiaceae bacterium]
MLWTTKAYVYPQYIFKVTDPSGQMTTIIEEFKLKYYYKHQIESAVLQSGLKIKDIFGSFDKAPFYENGKENLLVCKK